MKLHANQQVHLTYCQNIHPGETWRENLLSIKDHTLLIRNTIAPCKPFGLGLRLSNTAALELREENTLTEFKSFLKENNLYVFTINGFPYGQFHGIKIKEKVYSPNWLTKERLDYTMLLADILVELLPDDVSGSISTVPGAYKYDTTNKDIAKITQNLADCAEHLQSIHTKTGKDICLALEPEPDCLIETTKEAISFFNEHLLNTGSQRLCSAHGHNKDAARKIIFKHLGYCIDTCHMAVEFESPLNSIKEINQHGIRIAKVQVSAAIKTNIADSYTEQMTDFCDKIYLHQVKLKLINNKIVSYKDLTKDLLKDLSKIPEGELRLHFHVPLYFNHANAIKSTNTDLTNNFFRTAVEIGVSHFEIETYTVAVLPKEIRSKNATQNIIKEYLWVLDKFNHLSSSFQETT